VPCSGGGEVERRPGRGLWWWRMRAPSESPPRGTTRTPLLLCVSLGIPNLLSDVDFSKPIIGLFLQMTPSEQLFQIVRRIDWSVLKRTGHDLPSLELFCELGTYMIRSRADFILPFGRVKVNIVYYTESYH
jgi:hypothetical protein